MADRPYYAPEYPLCKHLRKEEKEIHISDEFALELCHDKDMVFPLFEKRLNDYRLMKHTSLETNKLLKCRWEGYLQTIEGKTRTPYKFPRSADFHYSNYFVRYNPSETITNRPSNRVRMRNGPGVDEYGQIPIPEDMHLRKTVHGKYSYKHLCHKL